MPNHGTTLDSGHSAPDATTTGNMIKSPVPTPYSGSLPEGKKGYVSSGSLVRVVDVDDEENEQHVQGRTGSSKLLQRPQAPIEQLSLSKADVIERAKELEEDRETLSAVSLLIATFDELFRRGQFSLCDSMLHRVDPKNYSTDMLVWIIKATRTGRSKLCLRAKFLERAKQVILDRRDLRDDAFDRLE